MGREDRHGGHQTQGELDPNQILGAIGVTEGQVLLDAGCGEGRFAIAAALMVGGEGKVYAVDTSKERIETLRRTAQSEGLGQIETIVANFEERLPLPSDRVNICLMANVFHELVENGEVSGGLSEIKRVLRPGGDLAILDFRKDVKRPPGPPLSRRVDPAELSRLVRECGFRQRLSHEVGRYHYLSIFRQNETAASR